MKKVLILAYDFPPYVSVGGLRPYNWYKYFREFGIEPVVVTRQWENKYGNELDYIAPSKSKQLEIENTEYGTILRTPYAPNLANKLLLRFGDKKFKYFRKFISLFFELFQFLLPIGPKYQIYKSAENYLLKNKIDVIIATGDPFVLFHYANKLSLKYRIPWVADYRDPWSQDIPLQNKHILKQWSTIQEKKVLKNVSKVITVSDFVAQKISDIYNADVQIVPNGYDPELINAASGIPQRKEYLSIAYAGTIYNWHPIDLFLSTLNEWVIENIEFNIKLNFYGVNNRNELEKKLNTKYENLKNIVVFHNRMSNKDLLYKMAQDNVFLLFNYYSFMGTKIYDYLGMKRKILFCFTNDKYALELKEKYYHIDESESPNLNLQADLIKETRSGTLVNDAKQLKDELTKLAEEFQSNQKISYFGRDVERFSRKLKTKQVAEIIEDVLNPNI